MPEVCFALNNLDMYDAFPVLSANWNGLEYFVFSCSSLPSDFGPVVDKQAGRQQAFPFFRQTRRRTGYRWWRKSGIGTEVGAHYITGARPLAMLTGLM